MTRHSALTLLLIGFILGMLLAPGSAIAQVARVIFVASSSGGVPAVGSAAGVLTVSNQ